MIKKKRSLKVRIFLSFLVFLVLFLLSSTWNFFNFQSIAESNRAIDKEHLPMIQTATGSYKQMYEVNNKLQQIAGTTMAVTINTLTSEIENHHNKLDANLDEMESYISTIQAEEIMAAYQAISMHGININR